MQMHYDRNQFCLFYVLMQGLNFLFYALILGLEFFLCLFYILICYLEFFMKENNSQKRNVKKFILFVIKVTLVLLCAYYAYQGLFWYLWIYKDGPRAYDKAYQHALYLQYEQIKNPDRDNEIIFFGSSTCAFGIDVDTVKDITGENAQIFGIESAISPKFLMKQLKEIAKPGDTIVCIFDGGDDSSEDFITTCCAFEDNKEFLSEYMKRNSYDFDIHKPTLIWRKIYALSGSKLVESVRSKLSEKDQVYKLSSFDENGNMKPEKDACFVSDNVDPSVLFTMDDNTDDLITMFNEFDAWCKDNNIRFVIAYNMHPEGSIINDEASLLEYHEAMTKAFTAEIITTPLDGVLPVNNFFNSYFHLNNDGAREYSKRIAEKL